MSRSFIDLLRTKLWAHCVVIESLSIYFISVRIAYRDGEIIASYRIRVLIKLEQSILFVSLFTFYDIVLCHTTKLLHVQEYTSHRELDQTPTGGEAERKENVVH